MSRLRGLWAQLGHATGLRRRPPEIPEPLWSSVLRDFPFLAWRGDEELARLRQMSAEFLGAKEFHGARGFEVTDEVALAVAAQACLPVIHIGLNAYDGFVGIVLHDGPVRARREVVDEVGLVHAFDEELVGEAVDGGPVMLSWNEGVADSRAHHQRPAGVQPRAFNVVIHEFVHLLDLLDGSFDGTPPLPATRRANWQSVLQGAFDRFDERSACGYPSIVDDYGAQDIGEFFAVTSEAFFTAPIDLREEWPDLYSLYATFFRQDPAAGQRAACRVP